MGIDPTRSKSALALSGLESLRQRELARVSRSLHDDIGPSLCSAGLMLGLLRSTWQDLPQDTRDMLDSIQDALETSVDAVRLLSYHAEPGIATRCGFRGAIDHLTRGRAVELDWGLAPPLFSPAEADFLCRLVRLALDRAVAPCRLSIGAASLTLSGAFTFDDSEHLALDLLARRAGLRLDAALDRPEARLAVSRPPDPQETACHG